jgi:hypothetical protein
MTEIVDPDVLVVGAGPAGLAAAHGLAASRLSVLVVDSGKAVLDRDRGSSREITRGQGGAGLFSDGKFSFFPSATELWRLPHAEQLRAAYEWTCDFLGAAGMDTPAFPEQRSADDLEAGQWALKKYPSQYLSLNARLDLTKRLVADLDAQTRTQTTVSELRYDRNAEVFRAVLIRDTGEHVACSARGLILANGRFGPLGMGKLIEHRIWRRLEIGLRLEQPSERSFLHDLGQVDPKLRYRSQDGKVEWRTFCACREGETVLTETEGLWTYSGRADCPPTRRSNVGFNTRILDESTAARALPHLLASLTDIGTGFDEPLNSFLKGAEPTTARIERAYGPEFVELIRTGLTHLIDAYPDVLTFGSRLIGPTLEGVGWYPKINEDLSLPGMPAWVAGDSCGIFRGIVAAMISGYYCGTRLLTNFPAIGAR